MNDQEMTEQVEPKKEMKASIFTVNEAISESAGEGEGAEGGRRQAPPEQNPAWAGDADVGVAESAGEGAEGGRRQAPPEQNPAWMGDADVGIAESAGEGAEGEAKKPKVPDYVKRMSKELDDLRDKTSKLINFTESKQFEAMPPLKRMLLTLQESAMTTYFSVLRLRYELEMLEIKEAWGEDNGKTE